MILKGLPRHFDTLSIYITRTKKELTFMEFKTEFDSFEETLKYRDVVKLTSLFS